MSKHPPPELATIRARLGTACKVLFMRPIKTENTSVRVEVRDNQCTAVIIDQDGIREITLYEGDSLDVAVMGYHP